MKNILLKTLVAASISITLVGCGGSESSDSSSGSGSVTENNYVSGSFSDLHSSSIALRGNGAGSEKCIYNMYDKVFESENAIVWGPEHLEDSDFKHAATLIEGAYVQALSDFELNKDEFLSKKATYTHEVVYGRVLEILNSQLELDESEKTKIMELFSHGGFGFESFDDLKSKYMNDNHTTDQKIRNAQKFMSQKEIESFVSFHAGLNIEYSMYNEDIGELRIPNKVLVCLDEGRSSMIWGEGTLSGMSVAPNSVAPRSDDKEVVHHELIHYIEINLTNPLAGGPIFDRWMSEGAAVYFSGQPMHNGSPTSNPIMVKSDMDEGASYSTDVGQAYKEYGQAFKYLIDTYGKESYMGLVDDVHSEVREEGLSGMSQYFHEHFSNNFTDYRDFELNYPNLVN